MKALIKQRFSKASHSYGKHDEIQKQSAQFLCQRLRTLHPEFQPGTVLDIGCGTGNLSVQLNQFYPNAYFSLNDISQEMLTQAQDNLHSLPQHQSILGDIEQITLPQHYDLVASNLCLQWTTSLARSIEKICHHANHVAISCLLSGSFEDWYLQCERYGLGNVRRTYPALTELIDLFPSSEPYQVDHHVLEYNKRLPNPLVAAQYLKGLGATATRSSTFDVGALRRLFTKENSECILTYRVGFILWKRSL